MLEASGRLAFPGQNEVVEGFGNGLFSVVKNTEVDRLILDGRPANKLQCPPNKYIMTMGAASTLLGIFLEPSEKLLMGGDDLSNFFYTFAVNEAREARNFLEWKIPVKIAQRFSCFPAYLSTEEFVYACLSSLAMGDSAACEYAQTAHISMGLQCGAFNEEHLLTLHGRVPRSHFMSGIIIDDYITVEKVHMDATHASESGTRRSRMHSVYKQVKLDAHPTKGFADEEVASFWGADLDGRAGLVRGSISRAASLIWVTVQVACLGVASVSLLEVLAGGFVSLFAFRRRMMSLLDWIYVVQGGREQRDILRLPAHAIDELWSLAILGSLAVTDLRSTFLDEIFMVDASNWGDAVVSAALPLEVSKEMHRHGVNKSCWTKLLSPFKAHLRGKALLSPEEELPGDEVAFTEHPLWEVCARGLDYQVCWKRQAKAGRHINRGELASFLRAEVLGARAGGDIRVAISSDSQVTLGAVSKGRSASPILNRCLKQSLPHVLGLGIYSSGGYVRSAFNPADDPTRGVALRIADIVLPVWWTALAQGNTRLFDEFLAACNLHPLQMSGFPSLNQLVMQDESVLDRSVRKSLRSFHLKIKKNLRLKAAAKVGKADAQVSKAWETCTGSGPHLTCEAQEMLTSFGREQFISHDSVWPPSQPGFLDLYSGRRGLARFAVSYGAPWVLCIDVKDGPQCDLLSPEVCKKIEHMLALGVFIFVSAAIIGTSFSRAITPAVRSFEHPDGLAGVSWRMREKFLSETVTRDGWLPWSAAASTWVLAIWWRILTILFSGFKKSGRICLMEPQKGFSK